MSYSINHQTRANSIFLIFSAYLFALQFLLRRMNKTHLFGSLITTSTKICGLCLRKSMVLPLTFLLLAPLYIISPHCTHYNQYTTSLPLCPFHTFAHPPPPSFTHPPYIHIPSALFVPLSPHSRHLLLALILALSLHAAPLLLGSLALFLPLLWILCNLPFLPLLPPPIYVLPCYRFSYSCISFPLPPPLFLT